MIGVLRNTVLTILIGILIVFTTKVITYGVIYKLIIADRSIFDEATGKVFDLFHNIASKTG